jgi:hypothetical protein
MLPRRLVHTSSIVWLLGQSAIAAPGVVYQTSVAPQSNEDVASPCRYEITLLDPSRTIRGVWVIFDRGRDMLRYYGDPDVQAFAQRHDLALMFPFHCAAKSAAMNGDMNVDPSNGLGRALFLALEQFAKSSRHPELASAKVVLLGFSGTGSLVARFPEYAPDRVLAVIAGDPGHFDPLGIDTITLSAKATAIPQLILAGSDDAVSGTERPYAYFRKYFDQGAPWTFIVQNGTPHCCIINAKALVLEWLNAVVFQHLTRNTGSYGFITTQKSKATECPPPIPPANPIWCRGATDSWGGSNWLVTSAKVEGRPTSPGGMMPAGWLPNRRFAQLWLPFVTDPQHPVTSIP